MTKGALYCPNCDEINIVETRDIPNATCPSCDKKFKDMSAVVGSGEGDEDE